MESTKFYRGHGSYSAKCVLESGFVAPPTLEDPPMTGELYATARLHTITDRSVYFTRRYEFAYLYALKEAEGDRLTVEAILMKLFPEDILAVQNLRNFFAERTFRAPLSHGAVSKKIRSVRAELRKLDASVGKVDKKDTLHQRLTILEKVSDKLKGLSATQLAEIDNQYPVIMRFQGIPLELQPLPPYITDPTLRGDLEWSCSEPVATDKITDIYTPEAHVSDMKQAIAKTRHCIRVQGIMLNQNEI